MTTALITFLLSNYGLKAYLIIFFFIFAETGFIFMPFLPGDMMLFLAGVFLVGHHVSPLWVILAFASAAIAGDTLNFSLGRKYGRRLLEKPFIRKFVKDEHLKRADAFFEKHGGLAVTLGRFIPVVRTLIPFNAGTSKMSKTSFMFFNILGGVTWISLFVAGGYFLSGVNFIQEYFEFIVIGFILACGLVAGLGYLLKKRITV